MKILNSAHFSDKKKVLKTLAKTGANINAKNDQGQTALHVAVNRGAMEFVKILIQNGANIHIEDNHGDTPLNLALKNGLNLAPKNFF